jgi:hypothetical protein
LADLIPVPTCGDAGGAAVRPGNTRDIQSAITPAMTAAAIQIACHGTPQARRAAETITCPDQRENRICVKE